MLERFIYFTRVWFFVFNSEMNNEMHLTEDWNNCTLTVWDFFKNSIRKINLLVYNSVYKFILGHNLPFKFLAKRQLFA